jgi:hypothetical protein
MKEKRPQFVKMNASREENPPPREVRCPDYRTCLTEAAFRNFCLDCSQCAAVDLPGRSPLAGRPIHTEKAPRIAASFDLRG